MKDAMEIMDEVIKTTKGVLRQQQVFVKKILQELAKEESSDIAPHVECVFDVIKSEYNIMLKIPKSFTFCFGGNDPKDPSGKEENAAEQYKDPAKKYILTDNERIECTVKWLNALYTAWTFERELKNPCAECRYFEHGCGNNVPPQANFKVLEQFTGEGTVISALVHQRADGPALM